MSLCVCVSDLDTNRISMVVKVRKISPETKCFSWAAVSSKQSDTPVMKFSVRGPLWAVMFTDLVGNLSIWGQIGKY